jgi:hypothetical protein
MGFANRAADREAHAHAVGLRRVEGFKETRHALQAQAMAGIPQLRSGPFSMDTLAHVEQFLGLDGESSITAPAALRDSSNVYPESLVKAPISNNLAQ